MKANFFSIDALLSVTLLITGLLALSVIPSSEKSITAEDAITEDILSAISTVRVSELNDPLIQQMISNGTIERSNNSVLVQAGEFWAQDDNALAEYLLTVFFDGTFDGSESYSFALTIAQESLYNLSTGNKSDAKNLLASRRMITGVEKGEAVTGSTASAFLRRVRDKRTSSYVYFGGFTGQGNITLIMNDIPHDVNPEDVTSLIIESDTPGDFDVYINNIFCDSLSPVTGTLEPDYWDISYCNSSITNDSTKFVFDGTDLNTAYSAGGFIKLSYKTDEFQKNNAYGMQEYKFPGINGIINLFDSFYVPGDLNSMQVFIHYFADNSIQNNTFYLTIGNTTVWADQTSTTIQSITLDDADLAALNYSQFSQTTVPLRLGFENLTYAVSYNGVADVMLITDVSGSMNWQMDSNNNGNTVNDCTDSDINDSNTKRISVAKCLDKDFVDTILNISGNEIGVVSYEDTSEDLISLTTDANVLTAMVNSYNAGGSTCICCAINTAKNELSNNLKRTIFVADSQEWNYTNNYLLSQPPNDVNNNTWYGHEYLLETGWGNGDAILGHDAGAGGITTEMGGGTNGDTSYVAFAEPLADQGTPEIEFDNGYTSTFDTYGWNQGDDGWDSGGQYVYDNGDIDYSWENNGEIEFDWRTGSPSRNRCNNYDCSGGYGITASINQTFLDILNADGVALISFNYYWYEDYNVFENNDEIWIKGKWVSPTTGEHYLGSAQSSAHGDATLEIDYRDNPNSQISDNHEQDISSWIEGTGDYYLELGGKLRASYDNEHGRVEFDNILLQVNNNTDNYYLRKHFTLSGSDLLDIRRAIINVMADQQADIYVNGELVHEYLGPGDGKYWDKVGIPVSGTIFREGDNVIAVKLRNTVADAKFDLEVVGFNDTRTGAILVMTDGQATVECNEQNTGDASTDAIQAACDASTDYGIYAYAVGISDNADNATLSGIAECGNGRFIKSDNASALGTFYQDTAIEIAEISRSSQTIIVTQGTPTESILYPDSYVRINFTPSYETPKPDEISIKFQTEQFANCTDTVTIFDQVRVIDAVVTSYSGPHWTNYVAIDNNTVFNLTEFDSNYLILGDPYVVQIPPSLLTSGTHDITIKTADGPENYTSSCSQNNSLIYTGLITSSTPRSQVVSRSEGCTWEIEFEDGTNVTEQIPGGYSGIKTCSYTNSSINYDSGDAYDAAVYDILSQLDFDSDGRVFINIKTEDLEIIVTLVSQVPYLWGPAVVQAEVWS